MTLLTAVYLGQYLWYRTRSCKLLVLLQGKVPFLSAEKANLLIYSRLVHVGTVTDALGNTSGLRSLKQFCCRMSTTILRMTPCAS